MRVLLVFLALGLRCGWGEVSCFRTPAQAAVQVGVQIEAQEGGGYRLEYVRQDPLGHRTWATVKNCAHPEWPAVVMATAASASDTSRNRDDKAVANQVHSEAGPVVVGGTRVKVVRKDAVVQLETVGVAQSSGRVGDRVLVRVGEDGRVVEAVVRGPDVLEMGQ